MSITYEDALSTLNNMFGPPWTSETLDAVLRHHEGHMENTVDSVLGHGDGDPAELVKKLQSGGGGAGGVSESGGGGDDSGARQISVDEEIARQLARDEENRGSAAGGGGGRQQQQRSGANAAAPGTRRKPTTGSGGAPTKKKTSSKKGRGTPTELPPDFLRIPGYKHADVDNDEQLARMLQDELFTQELANNPEFAHLARGGAGRGRGRAVPPQGLSGRWNMGSDGLRFGGPAPQRTASRSSVGGYPGRPGQQQEGPNIMDKLSEMGENAKRRLALLAAQFNANNASNANASRGGPGGTSGAVAERRGLLDGNDEEEVSFLGRQDTDVEMSSMRSPGGVGAGGSNKKDK